MATNDFAFWLQGFVELNGGKMPTPEQWQMIVEHLATVFNKVTPPLKMPGSVIPYQEIKYCSNVPLDVCGPSFKMPPGATGDIGNGIQIFTKETLTGNKGNPYGGVSGVVDDGQYKDWHKKFEKEVLGIDKGTPLDYSQTLITC